MTPAAVLFWDIDGTILTTARAGIHALEAALADVCGVERLLDDLVTAGLTDAEVARLALHTAGCVEDDVAVASFLRAYESHLPDVLHRRQGHVLPGVAEILADLEDREDVLSLLLTGNTAAGARAKLAHYGVDRFFVRGGAFCVGPGARADIAREALVLAGEVDPRRSFVIGDTVHDIAAGDAIGVRTIAVATGSYSADELSAAGAWLVLERLPEPDAFRGLIGIR